MNIHPDIFDNSTVTGIWTIADGIAVARILEPVAIANGWHVALGGSVLHQGTATHDVDLILYPHTPIKNCTLCSTFVTMLSEIGFEQATDLSKKNKSDINIGQFKQVFAATYMGRRVDLIFINPPQII